MAIGNKSRAEIVKVYDEIIANGLQETEDQFRASLNDVVRLVELEKSYSTNRKLDIYELLTQISNCTPKERERYGRKIRRLLK
ncbi:MAG: hypothetical protein IKF00_03095 [Solobacterium sp.]|jgi:hypothetical protein|nr:hypothetical protein [Solobacterium sp.]MBR3343953.1 hypothetical protein [Solobacterium sp.]HAE17548.1 hypothetical protein [Erysipelotrichaceae bacterium]